jgi:hypothetical protein
MPSRPLRAICLLVALLTACAAGDADEDLARQAQAFQETSEIRRGDEEEEAAPAAEPDHHDLGSEEGFGPDKGEALDPSAPLSSALAQSCTTMVVKELATQLVQEINCMKPGSMRRIDEAAGLSLGSAVFPYLQTPAAKALVAAQKVRNVTMSINSGLRTLPQQYLLRKWFEARRCGIGLAAPPGKSNHESGIAVDINDNAAWRSAMKSKKYKWLGVTDPVHFDYVGAGTVDMKGLSVKAFQRLWNRNNPHDKIPEDGRYGTTTEKRLLKSPVGGFARGAICTTPIESTR